MEKISPNNTDSVKISFISIFILIAIFISITFLFLRFFRAPFMWDFRNNLYLPLNLLIQNQSPYHIQTISPGITALWFPMAFGFFFPLGYVNFVDASAFWLLLNIAGAISMVWMASRKHRPSPILLGLCLILIFIFPSTSAHLKLGQISILISLAMVIIIVYFQKLPDWAMGFLITFSLIKPQLSVFFVPGFLYAVFQLRGWATLKNLLIWTFSGLVISLLPIYFYFPNWFPDLISNYSNNPIWGHPSIFTHLLLFFELKGFLGSWILSIIGIVVSIFIINNFHKSLSIKSVNREIDVMNSLFWILAITPIFSPYVWSWDFVLIFPLMVFQIFKLAKSKKIILAFIGYFAILILYVIQKLSGQIDDLLYWWIPWGMIGFTVLINFLFNSKDKILTK